MRRFAQRMFFEMLLPKQLSQNYNYITFKRFLNQRKLLISPTISSGVRSEVVA